MAVQFDSASLPLPSSGAASATPPAATSGSGAAGFGATLEKMLQSVDTSAGEANTAVANMVDGKGDVHDAMIALQRAEMNLQLTVQTRNKLVSAYQEIMRMPV
jgi:flagellar hook-basal body complex protein FliE